MTGTAGIVGEEDTVPLGEGDAVPVGVGEVVGAGEGVAVEEGLEAFSAMNSDTSSTATNNNATKTALLCCLRTCTPKYRRRSPYLSVVRVAFCGNGLNKRAVYWSWQLIFWMFVFL